VEGAILRALAKERSARFPSARAFVDALDTGRGLTAAAARRTIVMLGVSGGLAATTVAKIVGPAGGVVAKILPTHVIVAFPGGGSAAAAAALRGRDPTVQIVEHAADLVIRESARGAIVSGPAIERPDWLEKR
jgi:hypothetical protein